MDKETAVKEILKIMDIDEIEKNLPEHLRGLTDRPSHLVSQMLQVIKLVTDDSVEKGFTDPLIHCSNAFVTIINSIYSAEKMIEMGVEDAYKRAESLHKILRTTFAEFCKHSGIELPKYPEGDIE